MLQNLEMVPCRERVVSPDEFKRIDESLIGSVRIVPPRLGEDDFGRVRVTFRTPIYLYPLK